MKDNQDYLCGRKPVEEALKEDVPLKKVFLSRQGQSPFFERITALCREKKVPLTHLEKRELDRLAPGVNHQGLLAAVAAYPYVSLEEALDRVKQGKREPLWLVLDHLQDPHNVGALLRTAEAAGVQCVVIPRHRAAGITAGAYKASAGAAVRMPVARTANIAQSLELLKERGFWVLGADIEGESVYTEADYRRPLALVVGAENKGLSRLVKDKCDILVKIPMGGKAESLNVSVAGAILLYEARRQRENC